MRISFPAREIRLAVIAGALLSFALADTARAGAQIEEELAANVRNSMHRSVSDYPAPHLVFGTDVEGWSWLADMSSRLAP